MRPPTVFLVVASVDLVDVLAVEGVDDAWELGPGVFFVEASSTRSKLYHRLKPLRSDSLLLVAEVDVTPKFIGAPAGSTAWARTRLGGS